MVEFVTDPDLLAELEGKPKPEEANVPEGEKLPKGAAPIAFRKGDFVDDPDLVSKLESGDTPTLTGAPTKTGAWRDSIPRIVQIESGGNPNAVTGKYRGLLQMGPDEIAQYGGSGLEHGTRLLEDRANQLQAKFGREPTGAEVYLAHQQGVAGALAHMGNPDAPAWQNMANTGEGRKKGSAWARQAIWGNVPDGMKAQFGDVDNVSSRDFIELWRKKVEGGAGSRAAYTPSAMPSEMPSIDPRLQPAGGGNALSGAVASAAPSGPPLDARLQRAVVDDPKLVAALESGEELPAEAPTPGAQGTATAGQALARGYYKTKGMLGGTVELAGEATGYDPLREYGTGVRTQAEQDVKTYPAQAEFLKIRGAGDAAQYAKETLLDFVPQIGAGILGATAGGVVGGPVGAAIGGFGPALALNLGDVQGQLKEKDPNAVAPGWVAAGGTAAAALDAITPFRLGSKLLMRFGKEAGEEIAKQTLERSAARGFVAGVGAEAGKSAAIEGTTEALQEVIGEMATSGALDRTPDWSGLPVRMTESFAAGALGGAVFGGGAHAITGGESAKGARTPGEDLIPPGEEPPGGPPAAPPGPAFPEANLPVGKWEENVPGDVVRFLRPNERAEAGVPTAETLTPAVEGITGPIESGGVGEVHSIPNRWYYSAVRQAAEKALPSAGSGAQMLNTLKNAKGVKQEELDALGIPEWIAAQPGKITKADLISQIETNAINVNTISKVEPPRPPELKWQRGVDAQGKEVITSPDSPHYSIQHDEADGMFWIYRRGRPEHYFSTLEKAQRWVEKRVAPTRIQDERKFEQYTVAGGQNYREHVLQLPQKKKPAAKAAEDARIADEIDRIDKKYAEGEQVTPDERVYYNRYSGDTETLRSPDLPPDFQYTAHFPDPNPLAHTRTKDRVMKDGMSTLHLEEVQSDWHQLGRKHGYVSEGRPVTKESIGRDIRELNTIIEQHEDALYDFQQQLRNTDRPLDPAQQGRVAREYDEMHEDLQVLREQRNALYNLEDRFEQSIADAPFKTSWAELAFKRMVHLAALEGKDRVSWTPGSIQSMRWQRSGMEAAGMREFYDQILMRIAKKMANKLPDARTGHAFLEVPEDSHMDELVNHGLPIPYFEMTENTRQAILGQGFAIFNRFADERPGAPANTVGFDNRARAATPWKLGDVNDARPQIKEAGDLIWRLARKLGITKKIELRIRSSIPRGGNAMARVWGLDKDGNYRGGNFLHGEEAHSYIIELALDKHETIEQVWASLSHELGHIVHGEFYERASPLLKLQIDEAYQRYVQERDAKGVSDTGKLFWMRDNFLVNWFDMRTAPGQRETPGTGRVDGNPFAQLSDKDRKYWLGFEEWFAEQTARHFTTSPVVLSAMDRFFARLANAMREIYRAFQTKFGLTATPDSWIAGWLDSRLTELPTIAAANDANKDALALANERAMNATGVKDYPRADASATSIPGRKVMAAVGETVEARAMAAAADRFNGFYRWMLSVVQVAVRNLHIQPLQRYVELWQQKQLERARMMSVAVETLRQWRNLGKKQADNVSAMLDEYMNMGFLSAKEVSDGVVRRPTDVELAEMQKQFGLNDAARKTFDKIVADFDTMLLQYEALMRAEANKISDLSLRMKRMMEISAQIAKMKEIPYAPAMRFGDLVLLVRDADGNTVSRYHFETEAKRKSAEKDLQKKLLPGETIHKTAIPEQAKPFLGLPPGLLDLISEKLNLSDEQRKVIAELKYEYAPAHGFQHRFQRKSRVPGYSMDFMRAYANYFFHGSNYFTNVKYVQALRDEIGLIKLSAEGLDDGTKRMQIHNFVNEHLNYMLDPKPDFAHLRGIMFHWGLGFSPAAAFVNLSQMALGSYPFLAGKFGDVGTISALTRAGTQVSTYYKRGTLAGMTAARDMRALSEGVKQGIITEAMAPELAGLTEQDNLRKGSFGKAAELARLFSEYSAFMFQTTEQINRRVTFRAAWQLALNNPAAKYVKEMIDKHSLQYESLIQQGWAANEAAAFVVAKDAVESTQFIYHQWANPRFMRGKFRSVFIFKNFLQNTAFMLWHYPEARVRAVLVFAFLGGMMGLPGADDMKSIIKAVGWRLFGKDWDVEQEARKLVIDMTSGKINPDLLLHGASRYGFGAHALMGLMGIPFPTPDMSKSIGLGRLLPVDPNTLLGQGASKDPKKALIDSVTQAAGYAFQVSGNFYNALTDTQLAWDDAQRWTKAMPRALAGLSKSYQALRGDDPAIRTRTGAAVIRFDTSDSVQLMDALSMAAGFQPQRLTQKWDVIMAQREAQEFWNLKREGLLRQAWQARNSDDKENYARAIAAIRSFNADLPPEARTKAITADNIITSFRTRATTTAKTELGIPTSMKDIPLVRSIQQLYPGADIDVHRTR